MSQSLNENTLFAEVKTLIQTAKQQAAVAINAELTLLYWQVGKRIEYSKIKDGHAIALPILHMCVLWRLFYEPAFKQY